MSEAASLEANGWVQCKGEAVLTVPGRTCAGGPLLCWTKAPLNQTVPSEFRKLRLREVIGHLSQRHAAGEGQSQQETLSLSNLPFAAHFE